MVIARVVLGSMIFFSYSSMLPHVQQIFGPNGVGGHATMQRFPGVAPGRPLESAFHFLHLVPSEELIWLLYLTLLAASLCFAAGAWTGGYRVWSHFCCMRSSMRATPTRSRAGPSC